MQLTHRCASQEQKQSNKGGLDPQALFFDSESRGVAASADGHDNAERAGALATQAQLMKIINNLQTHAPAAGPGGYDINTNSFSGGVATGKHSMVPPEVPPSLMCIPRGQEVVYVQRDSNTHALILFPIY